MEPKNINQESTGSSPLSTANPPTSLAEPSVHQSTQSNMVPKPPLTASTFSSDAQPIQQPTASSVSLPKSVHTTGLVAIILGSVLLVIAILLAWFIDITAIFNGIFSVLYITFGTMLYSKNIKIKPAITGLKIIMLTIAINLIAGLLSGGSGIGVLPLLVLFFSTKAFKEMFEAGLTTSKAPLAAKAK